MSAEEESDPIRKRLEKYLMKRKDKMGKLSHLGMLNLLNKEKSKAGRTLHRLR